VIWRSRAIVVDGITLTQEQARAVWRQVHATARRSNRVRWYLFLTALFVAVLSFGAFVGDTAPRFLGIAGGALLGASMGGFFVVALKYGFILVFRKEIRLAMHQLGYSLCPHCGYWLMGIGSSKCPECGTPVPTHQAP
jgi:hypothetical protein